MLYSNIPDKILNKMDQKLKYGEQIKWSAMTNSAFSNPRTKGTIFFAFIWNLFVSIYVFAVFSFEFIDFSEEEKFYFYLVAAIFASFGLFLICISFFVYKSAKNTAYFVTSERALTVIKGIKRISIRSHYPNELRDVSIIEKNDKTGDVIFKTIKFHNSEGQELSEEIGFFGINNPYEVEKTIKKMLEYNDV